MPSDEIEKDDRVRLSGASSQHLGTVAFVYINSRNETWALVTWDHTPTYQLPYRTSDLIKCAESPEVVEVRNIYWHQTSGVSGISTFRTRESADLHPPPPAQKRIGVITNYSDGAVVLESLTGKGPGDGD